MTVEEQVARAVEWAEAKAKRTATPVESVKLRPFQRTFVRAVESRRYDQLALSIPRGNGKSWLAAYLARRAVTPGDRLFIRGAESVLLAASLEQCRIVFKFIRDWIGEDRSYRFQDSRNAVGLVHKPTDTRIRALGSNGKTAMGIGASTALAICDEPGCWEDAGGQLLADAIDTALGKPGSRMLAIYIGTIAPSVRGWWPDLIDGGTAGRTYVQALRADPEKWDRWPEIRRVNPLTMISRQFRAKLLEERDKGRGDDRLRARFCSYRLNTPQSDPATVLLTADDWARVIKRPVPPGVGLPLVGVDAGGSRAWTAATFAWADGRVEALAVIPGIPSIAKQEQRDGVAAGVYQRLADAGRLIVAEGKRVPEIGTLIDAVFARSTPYRITCDSYRAAEVRDAVRNRVRVESRAPTWELQTEDVTATRRAARDGALAVAAESRPLLALALSESKVKSDDTGNMKIVKRRTANRSRDDSVTSLAVAVGAAERERAKAKAKAS